MFSYQQREYGWMCLIVLPFPFSLWLPRSSELKFWLNINNFVWPHGLHVCIFSFLPVLTFYSALYFSCSWIFFLLFIFFNFIACFLVSFLRSFVEQGGTNKKWLQLINRIYQKHSLITLILIWELELQMYLSGFLLSNCVSWFGEGMVLQLWKLNAFTFFHFPL